MVSPQEFAENFKKILPAVRQNKLPFFIVAIALISAGGTVVKLYDSRKLDSYEIDIKDLKRLVDEKDTTIKQNVKEISELNQKLSVVVGTRGKFSLLTAAQLKEKAYSIAKEIRQSGSDIKKRETEAIYAIRQRMNSATSTQEKDRLWEEQSIIYDQSNLEHKNKYNSLKTDLITLRDEMIHRIQSSIKDSVTSLEKHWYENPVNDFGYEKVAGDLEQLANRLSENFDVNASVLSPYTR